MNVLIVYAHPKPKWFNGAMRDVAVETLGAAGHSVVVSDLYAVGFQAMVGVGDFTSKRENALPSHGSCLSLKMTPIDAGLACGLALLYA